MSSKLEIALTEADGKTVSLKAMSADAIDSFMATVSSLKAIAVSLVDVKELNFSISEGSALCELMAPEDSVDSIYQQLDIAIQGSSNDKQVTGNLRNIQDQLKRENYKYRFLYKRNKKPDVNLHSRLINSKRISLKRSRRAYEYQLKVMRGLLNQIGGKNPNYHFDYGGADKITIDCTVEQATEINKYLYTTVESLILCKVWHLNDKKDEYSHKTVVSDFISSNIRKYVDQYNKEEDIIAKLSLTHDFIDDMFTNSEYGKEALLHVLLAFNDINFHLSELKTALVISKPFKNDKLIKTARTLLSETYNLKKQRAK